MQDFRDNYSLTDENNNLLLALYSVQADRPEQQDCAGYSLNDDEGLIVVCDGMGGLNGGKLASNAVVSELIDKYENDDMDLSPYELFSSTVDDLDSLVYSLTDKDGDLLGAGSTIASVIIKDNMLNWLSVGDSRIYIKRKNELICITKDHNYKMLLDQRKADGNISDEEYQSELREGEGLISYLGINGLPVIDCNQTSVELKQDDEILITTDGLYKMLDEKEIFEVLDNFLNISDILSVLDMKTQRASRIKNKKRDNITMALIKIK